MGSPGLIWQDDRRRSIGVLLVTSSFVLRFGLGSALERAQFEIVGELGLREDLGNAGGSCCPDLIAMEVDASDNTPSAAIEAMKARFSEVPILLLCPSDSLDWSGLASQVGIAGVLPSDSPFELITSALATLFHGGRVLPRNLPCPDCIGAPRRMKMPNRS